MFTDLCLHNCFVFCIAEFPRLFYQLQLYRDFLVTLSFGCFAIFLIHSRISKILGITYDISTTSSINSIWFIDCSITWCKFREQVHNWTRFEFPWLIAIFVSVCRRYISPFPFCRRHFSRIRLPQTVLISVWPSIFFAIAVLPTKFFAIAASLNTPALFLAPGSVLCTLCLLFNEVVHDLDVFKAV